MLVLLIAVTMIPGAGGCGSSSAPPTSSANGEGRDDSTALASSSSDNRSRPAQSDIDPAADPPPPEPSRAEIIAKAEEFVAKGDYASAADALKSLLLVDPNDVEVLFRLAGIKAVSGDLQTAVDLLGAIPADHPEAGLPALGQSADWCFQLKQFEKAERLYRAVLEQAPQAAPALRQLAYLLNRQGRRHEAARYIHQLCLQGNVRQDELHSLIVLGYAMYDSPNDASSGKASENAYWPIGPGGQARKRFSDGDYATTVSLLRPSVEEGKASQAAIALFGLAAVEAQDDANFRWWLSRTSEATQEFAEYWAAIGAYLLGQRKFPQATRALAEAIDRDPTDLRSMGRLRQAFLVAGDNESAERWFDRWTLVRESLRINNQVSAKDPPDPDKIAELASLLEKLERPLEAILWNALERHYRKSPPSDELNRKRQALVSSGTMFPTQSQRLCSLDLKQYPLPEIDSLQTPVNVASQANKVDAAAPAKFEDVAKPIGLDHTYWVATDPVDFGFPVYQMLGGGVVCLDYDLDGYCDLYFAQGGADPPTFQGERSNQLFRHRDSRLMDVTTLAGTVETQYTIGATAGDVNQDGFPDLVITNIGADMLLINNGDGTFARRSLTEEINTNRVPSSAAIADLTGDGLPDIYQANYVDDPRRTVKPNADDTKRPLQPILPSKFQPGADRLIENDGRGNFVTRRLTPDESADHTSLGVIVTDFDGSPGNEIFVANDMKPNQLWVRQPERGWFDAAPVRGCAFSFTGAATAAMGVAAGDLTNNGFLDLHITNYQDESVSLFVGEGGMFRDRHLQFQLATDSQAVLGFGTQSIDYDNDAMRDLVVTNGHIDDAIENTGPFRQAPQLFANLGHKFQLTPVEDASGYWDSRHVGRGVARLDFDRNGKCDFVITHIDRPSALMLNQTETDHHWLQLQLTGTTSERDCIGAKVRLRFGQVESTGWVIAGDGYLCRNENVVCFGVGEADIIEEIEIDWPSGKRQTFQQIPVDQRLLVVENDNELYTLFSAP